MQKILLGIRRKNQNKKLKCLHCWLEWNNKRFSDAVRAHWRTILCMRVRDPWLESFFFRDIVVNPFTEVFKYFCSLNFYLALLLVLCEQRAFLKSTKFITNSLFLSFVYQRTDIRFITCFSYDRLFLEHSWYSPSNCSSYSGTIMYKGYVKNVVV